MFKKNNQIMSFDSETFFENEDVSTYDLRIVIRKILELPINEMYDFNISPMFIGVHTHTLYISWTRG